MKVVPAILAEKFDDFVKRLRQAESFTDYVQVDLMDGVFVGTRSFPPEKITAVQTSLSFEVHLMVADPVRVADLFSGKWSGGTREGQRIRARGREAAPGEEKREMCSSKLIVSSPAKGASELSRISRLRH